jgi:hypothetical protein
VKPLALLAALLAISCGPGLAPGYRALTLGARIGTQVESDLGGVCKARRLACEAKHPVGDLRTACELPCLRALRAWSAARASYNAAAEVTWGGLETARLAKSKADWIALLKPGLCAVMRALDSLRPVMGEKVTSLLAPLAALEGVTCGGTP